MTHYEPCLQSFFQEICLIRCDKVIQEGSTFDSLNLVKSLGEVIDDIIDMFSADAQADS